MYTVENKKIRMNGTNLCPKVLINYPKNFFVVKWTFLLIRILCEMLLTLGLIS